MLSWIHTEPNTDLLNLEGNNVVAELIGKKRSKHENNKITWWKRCTQTSILDLRSHVAQLQEQSRGKLSKNRMSADLELVRCEG